MSPPQFLELFEKWGKGGGGRNECEGETLSYDLKITNLCLLYHIAQWYVNFMGIMRASTKKIEYLAIYQQLAHGLRIHTFLFMHASISRGHLVCWLPLYRVENVYYVHCHASTLIIVEPVKCVSFV